MIRPAVIADLPRLMVLAAEMHRESRFRDYPYDEGKVATLISHLVANRDGDCFAWVAEVDAEVVGTMMATVYESWFSSARVASDYGLFLHPKHRGGTTAGRLVKRYKQWGREQGARDIEMGCNTGVAPEAFDAFIKFMGFRETARLYTARD